MSLHKSLSRTYNRVIHCILGIDLIVIFALSADIYGCDKHLKRQHVKNEILTAQILDQVPLVSTNNTKTANNSCSVGTQVNSLTTEKSQNELNEYSRKMHDCIAVFVAELCSSTNISRAFTLALVQKCNKLNQQIFSELITTAKCRPLSPTDIECLGKIAENGFSLFNSDHRISKVFQQINTYIPSYSKEITCTLKPKRKRKRRELTSHTIKIEVIPMGLSLKAFLELPDVFEIIMVHMKKCRASGEIISPIQGVFWKTIESRFNADQVVMPIIIFGDQWEMNGVGLFLVSLYPE